MNNIIESSDYINYILYNFTKKLHRHIFYTMNLIFIVKIVPKNI